MTQLEWERYGARHLVGRTIVAVRYLTDAECAAHEWDAAALVLLLDDGTAIYPSRDDEGNGPGALFGLTVAGDALTFPVFAHR